MICEFVPCGDCPCDGCQCEEKNGVTMTFYRSELLYDVENMAYVEGDIHKTNDEHDRHQIIDAGQDGNIDRIDRVFSLAYEECVEFLYPYSKLSSDEEEERDDILTSPEKYVIKGLFPTSISKTTISLVAKLIHEYITCKALADWMSITKPDAEDKWARKAIAARDKIKSALCGRLKRVRRTLTPF